MTERLPQRVADVRHHRRQHQHHGLEGLAHDRAAVIRSIVEPVDGIQQLHMLLDRDSDRIDLLHESRTDMRRQRAGARPGDEGAKIPGRQFGESRSDFRQHFRRHFRLVRFVPLIATPQNLECGRIKDDALHGGRSDINSYKECLCHGLSGASQG